MFNPAAVYTYFLRQFFITLITSSQKVPSMFIRLLCAPTDFTNSSYL
jgi:hypothetical protein